MNQSTLTLPIETGKKYVRRDGKVVIAQVAYKAFNYKSAYVGDGRPTPYGDEHVWRDCGKVSPVTESTFDLVADYVEGHVHALLMAEYAQDALKSKEPWLGWEINPKHPDGWKPCTHSPSWDPTSEYRRAKETFEINGIKVPKPETSAPADGQTYWLPVIIHVQELATKRQWCNSNYDQKHLARGMIHLTQHGAEKHAQAIISFTEEKLK